MWDFLLLYFTLSGPAVLAGLSAGAGSYLVFGGRDTKAMLRASGVGVMGGMASAFHHTTYGETGNGYSPVIVALAVGVTIGYIMRPRCSK